MNSVCLPWLAPGAGRSTRNWQSRILTTSWPHSDWTHGPPKWKCCLPERSPPSCPIRRRVHTREGSVWDGTRLLQLGTGNKSHRSNKEESLNSVHNSLSEDIFLAFTPLLGRCSEAVTWKWGETVSNVQKMAQDQNLNPVLASAFGVRALPVYISIIQLK